MNLTGKIRKVVQVLSGGDNEVTLDPYGGIAISSLLPKYAQLNAAGKIFAFDMSGGTAIAPSVAIPTTTPSWAIYNANPGGGPTIFLLWAGISSESGTLGLGLALMGAVAIGPQTAASSSYSGTIINCLDGSQKKPNAYLVNDVALLGGAPAWVTLVARDQVSAISVGSGLAVEVGGLLSCPPGGKLCFDVVAPVGTTALFDANLIIAEVQM